MNPQLPPDIASLDELDMEIAELDAYIAARRQLRIRQEVSKVGDSALPCSAELRVLMDLNKVQPEDEAGLTALAKALAEYRSHVPRLTLVLADAPSLSLRRHMADWLRLNVGTDVLLNIRVAAEIGGGVVIQTPSHVFDHSFRRVILENRTKLMEIIQNVR